VRHLSFTLAGPFEEALTAAMPAADRPVAEELTQVVNRLLVWSLQVARDGRRGDRVDVLYELPAPGAPGVASAAEPVVHAIRYASQKLGKIVAAYRFQPASAPWARYYRDDGAEVEERLVDAPVEQYDQITSLLRDGRRHKGVDFRTPAGTPVHAPFDAVVERRNWNFAGNGNCLDLRDPASGRHAIFLHLEPLPREMAPGRAVKKGEVVARSGNSGHSTAPHLHYQLEGPDGRILDPFEVLPVRRVSLEGAALQAFQSERARLDAVLGAPGTLPVAAPVARSGRAGRGR
jgi:murein DD-endopeptidase MepM/ murein hydrolase activator NlpD